MSSTRPATSLPPSGLRPSARSVEPRERTPSPYGDQFIGSVFRNMRGSLGMTAPQLAARIGTTSDVIQILEGGFIAAFPPRDETLRLLTTIGALVQVDVGPVMQRIDAARSTVMNGVERIRLAQVSQGPSSARTNREQKPASAPAGAERLPNRRKLRRTLQVAMILVAATAALFITWNSLGAVAAANLPEPLQRVLQPVFRIATVQSTSQRDGLKWIEVADPRTRKTDKLPIRER